MANRSFFLTGTDTDIGKTHVAEQFLKSAARRGESAAGLKVLSAGLCSVCSVLGKMTPLADCSCDATRLQAASSLKLTTDQISPYVLGTACSPNIAADFDQLTLRAQAIAQQLKSTAKKTDCLQLILEGAGGWFTPINDAETLADVAVLIKLPVVLVVGVKLGCLNQAILSERAILSMGCQLLGWVASEPEPAQFFEEQVQTLQSHLSAPCLGVVRHDQSTDLLWPTA